MTNKTYSEQRAAILFKAARDLRKVAASVLDDVQNPVELQSMTTLEWAKRHAARIAKEANEVETLAYEAVPYLSNRQEATQMHSRTLYGISVTAFVRRIEEQGGQALVLAVNAIETGV